MNAVELNHWQPASVAELQSLLEQNSQESRQTILPVGGETSLPPLRVDSRLSTRQLNRIVDYPARDLTITAEAGVSVQRLGEVLAEQGQRLPVDVPFSGRATLGGAIACNVSGPRRYGHGTLRDYVIGISAVDGRGRLFSAGGRVVKNVAGYDLCKLLIGSEGTLAVITQVTLKVKPMAATSALLRMTCATVTAVDHALRILNTSATRPIVLDVLNPAATDAGYELYIGYEGSLAETAWQAETVAKELSGVETDALDQLPDEEAQQVLQRLTAFTPAARTPVLTARVGLRPSQTAVALNLLGTYPVRLHAGNGVLTMHLPQSPDALDVVAMLRRQLAPLDGTLTVWSPPSEWTSLDRYGSVSPAWRLNLQIKAALDPAGLLSPGWFDL